ncbi:MAG: mechanosensitive ion channel family protein [Armatimonadetes bacterium]|nr:mechanosensitive ion channel family protein [Armatimonadota bacterium]
MGPESAEFMLSAARAAFIFGSGVLVALAVHFLAPRFAAALSKAGGQEEFSRRHVAALSLLIIAAVLVVAGYAALNELALTPEQRALVAKISVAFLTAVATLVAIRLVGYGFEAFIARGRHERAAIAYFSLIRKTSQIALLVIGILLILDQFGYRATALLTGVGLASLGIGLALQDTMANFFAGIWLAVDRPVGRGDYIELSDGPAGFVEEIGWRHCRLRTWDDKTVVVPNSHLASTVLINHSLPRPEMSVYVPCGVSYESDLGQVEQICLEVGRQVQQTVPGAVRSWEPRVLFNEFADENINFIVALRVADPSAQRQITHTFIKALKARFDAEGIEINYPVRTVYLRGEHKGVPPRLAGLEDSQG